MYVCVCGYPFFHARIARHSNTERTLKGAQLSESRSCGLVFLWCLSAEAVTCYDD